MQKITITLAPNITVEVTDEHETKLFRAAAFWAELPTECPVCKSKLVPTFRTPQSYTYYGLRCLGTPSHSVNLGEAKETHNLYFDRSKSWTVWGSADPATPETASSTNPGPPPAIPSPAGDPFNLTPPPATSFPNDPNSVRGKMIAAINEMRPIAVRAKLDLSDLNFNGMGGMSDEDIAAIGRKLRHRIDQIPFQS